MRVIKQKIPPINPIVIIRICNASGKFVKMTPPLIVTSIMDKGESVSGIYTIEKRTK